jgi:hypothetical protein
VSNHSVLQWVASKVEQIKPGQRITFSGLLFMDIAHEIGCSSPLSFLGEMAGLTMNPIERVMEKVIGSAYEIHYEEDPVTSHIHFYRLTKEQSEAMKRVNMRTYVSPDRRHQYKKVEGGWIPV